MSVSASDIRFVLSTITTTTQQTNTQHIFKMAEAFFVKINEALNTAEGKAAGKKVNEVIAYEFPDTGKFFVMDLKNGKAAAGKDDDAACTFKMDEKVFLDLAGGKADAMGLFMEGKVELDGDTDVAMKLTKVLKALGDVAKM